MKQKDITLIIVVVIFSSIFAFLLSSMFIGSPETQPQRAETVEPITAEFNEPDNRYFNREAINPTQLIRIGGQGGNQSPFYQPEDE